MAKRKKIKMKIWQKTGRLAKQIFIGLILIFVGLLLLSLFSPTGFKMMSVKSGSMSPAIKTGSLIFTWPEKKYKVNDIVTFIPKNSQSLVTHRIVSINPLDQDYFQTKGDANDSADPQGVSTRQIVGRVFLTLPFLGRFFSNIQTKAGFTIFVFFPALLVIGSEVFNIRDELARLRKARRKRKNFLKPRVKKLPI